MSKQETTPETSTTISKEQFKQDAYFALSEWLETYRYEGFKEYDLDKWQREYEAWWRAIDWAWTKVFPVIADSETLKDTLALRSFDLSAELKKAEERITELEKQLASYESPNAEKSNKILRADCTRVDDQMGVYCEMVESPEGNWVSYVSHCHKINKMKKRIRELETELDAALAGASIEAKRADQLTAENVNYKNSNLTLTAENERLKDEADFWKRSHATSKDAANGLIADLEARLKLATDALEFYAKHHHWLKTTAPNFAQEFFETTRNNK